MKLRFNVWMEDENGDVLLSRWRIQLLETIARTGSINTAANEMHITYARAWEKIRQSEERLGKELIETRTGGRHGGGSSLTPYAEEFISAFREMEKGIERFVREHEQDLIDMVTPKPGED